MSELKYLKPLDTMERITRQELMDRYRRSDYAITYDEATYPLLDKLFELVRQIEPASQNGARILWLCADRGTLEDYGNYEEMLDCGEVANREEFEKLWNG